MLMRRNGFEAWHTHHTISIEGQNLCVILNEYDITKYFLRQLAHEQVIYTWWLSGKLSYWDDLQFAIGQKLSMRENASPV